MSSGRDGGCWLHQGTAGSLTVTECLEMMRCVGFPPPAMAELSKAYEPGEVEGIWYQRWVEAGCFRGDETSDKPVSVQLREALRENSSVRHAAALSYPYLPTH